MSWKNRLRALSRRDADAPQRAQGDKDVDDELLFHLRSLVDENMSRGMSHEEAWNDAQRRFGSLRRYWLQSRRAMLARVPLVLRFVVGGGVVVALVVGWLAWEARSLERRQQIAQRDAETAKSRPRPAVEPASVQPDPPEDQPWADKLAALDDGNWRRAFAVGQSLAALPPDEGYAIVEKNWHRIGSVEAKQQILKAWVFAMPYPLRGRNHPRILEVLNLGMHAEPQVQSWAINYLRRIALRDFAEDFAAYEAWYKLNRARPLDEVAQESIRHFVARVGDVRDAASAQPILLRVDATSLLRRSSAARATAIDAGLVPALERLTAAGLARGATRQELEAAQRGLRLLGALELPEDELRRVVVPLISGESQPEIRSAAIRALERGEFDWTVPLLVDALRRAVNEQPISKSVIWTAAGALGEIGDASAIEPMIEMIESDNTHATIYGVGYYGLGKLTGVQFDEKHDGAWWRAWWEKNKARYADVWDAEVSKRKVRIQEISYRAQDDVADVPAQDLRAGGDPKKRYFLIGEADKDQAPEDGYKLLFVLPGGDGGADFHPFVKRIYKHALNEQWLIAEPVAPEWDKKQLERIVWPTAKSRYPAANFSTEALIAAILRDVRSKVPLDPRRIFMLGWSSGGPPVYSTTLTRKSPVVGAFVAMSIFVPSKLPALSGGKDKAFYLLQSPDDRVTKFFFAERADKALGSAGARVKLEPYAGGHGWRGNVYGMLRNGIAWLEQNAAPGD